MKINTQLTLDFKLKNYIDIVPVKRGDTKSRFIDIKLRDNGLPVSIANHTVKIYALKPDGKKVFNEVVIVDPAAGLVTVELTNQLLAVVGLVKCELSIYGTDTSLIASRTFFVDVDETIRDDAAIVSSNEFTALSASLDKVSNLEANYTPRLNNVESQLADRATKTELQAVASGSPKAVFATLANLQADTTANTVEGKKSIYVVKADGNWYYWNGTTWTPGGEYLSKFDLDKEKLTNDIKGTKQSVTYNPDGTIQKITHTNSASSIVRTDSFTYSGNIITEVRTLSSGATITYKYNLTTLEVEVI